MSRQPRFVLPGQPQHVIQRGNNRDVGLSPMRITVFIWKSWKRHVFALSASYTLMC